MSNSSVADEEIFAFSQKFARKLYGSIWQEADREDFAQELAIKLLRAAERFDPNKGVPWRAYATIIARGAFLDRFRKINNNEVLLWEYHTDKDDDYSAGDQIEILTAVEDFIDFTPREIVEWSKQFSVQKQKVIICLALGYSRAEISRLIGVSEGRVTRIIREIQHKILSALEN